MVETPTQPKPASFWITAAGDAMMARNRVSGEVDPISVNIRTPEMTDVNNTRKSDPMSKDLGGVTEELSAHEIALAALYWRENQELIAAASALRNDGYNNAKGHLSNYMAGRFLDAYTGACAAIAIMQAAAPAAVADRERYREALEEAKAALDATPELNMSNYDHDDVAALNDGAIGAWKIIDTALHPEAAASVQAKP